MADVTVESATKGSAQQLSSMWGPYWTSPSVGYIVYRVGFGIQVKKTTDSGANWTEQDSANNPGASNTMSLAAYFDQETKDDSGTIIHIAWLRKTDNDVQYVQFDTSDDTFGTIRTVDALTVSSANTDSDISVTKAKSGRVYVAASGDMDAHTENTDHSMRSSDEADAFATENTSRLSPYSADEEIVLLLPGADADTDDICAVVYDTIQLDLEFWKFDASANTWGVTAIDTGVVITQTEARTSKRFFDAASRHSDEHILLVYWNDFDSATGDFKSVDITQATPTITAKTDLDTNGDDSFYPSILINQQNDDVYAAYVGSDANDESIAVTIQCYFKKSTDGMGVWGTEQDYGTLDDDLRMTHLGRTVGNSGGRVMASFYNDDLDDILINDGNDIEIAAVSVATSLLPRHGFPMRHLIGR